MPPDNIPGRRIPLHPNDRGFYIDDPGGPTDGFYFGTKGNVSLFDTEVEGAGDFAEDSPLEALIYTLADEAGVTAAQFVTFLGRLGLLTGVDPNVNDGNPGRINNLGQIELLNARLDVGDIVNLGDGNDCILARSGNDIVFGGAGNDALHGEDGADLLFGGDGNDVLMGGADGDLLSGDDGNDQLFGGAGNDWLMGGDGDDVLEGGDGNDLMESGEGADQLGGGDGIDTASYAASDNGVNVDLSLNGPQSGGHAEGDTLASIENLIGSAFGDTLKGGAGANVINGGNGGDTLSGGDGGDTDTFLLGLDFGSIDILGNRDEFTDTVWARATFADNGTDIVAQYSDRQGGPLAPDIINLSDTFDFSNNDDTEEGEIAREAELLLQFYVFAPDVFSAEIRDYGADGGISADDNTWFVIHEDTDGTTAGAKPELVTVEVDGFMFQWDFVNEWQQL